MKHKNIGWETGKITFFIFFSFGSSGNSFPQRGVVPYCTKKYILINKVTSLVDMPSYFLNHVISCMNALMVSKETT